MWQNCCTHTVDTFWQSPAMSLNIKNQHICLWGLRYEPDIYLQVQMLKAISISPQPMQACPSLSSWGWHTTAFHVHCVSFNKLRRGADSFIATIFRSLSCLDSRKHCQNKSAVLPRWCSALCCSHCISAAQETLPPIYQPEGCFHIWGWGEDNFQLW